MTPAGPGFRLLAITPPRGAVDPALVGAWSGAAAIGLAVLLREPGTRVAALLDRRHRLHALREACTEHRVPWLLSIDATAIDDLDAIVDQPGLAGIQVRGDPGPDVLERARLRLRPGQVLGRSCHGPPNPPPTRVDYSVLAPIFAPRTASPGPGPGKVAVGLSPLRAWAAAEPHVFALGGITPASAPACRRAGAFGLAGIRSFFGPLAEVADNVARLVLAWAEPSAHASPSR